ncbi:MAG: VOC family protein, partial [Acidimicrobiia bacterium]
MTSTTDPTHAYAMLRFVDHLVYSTPDLDEGIHLVDQLFGTDVTPGGRHENWGTRNALVSLSEASYLKIIGPDPQRSIRQTETVQHRPGRPSSPRHVGSQGQQPDRHRRIGQERRYRPGRRLTREPA